MVCTTPPAGVRVRMTFDDPVVTAHTTSGGATGVGVGVGATLADGLGVVAGLPPQPATASDAAIAPGPRARRSIMLSVSLSAGCPEWGGGIVASSSERALDP